MKSNLFWQENCADQIYKYLAPWLVVSLIDNLTYKCIDSNRRDASFNFNMNTYFHKDYSLPVTEFQLLMTIRGVH